MIYQVTPVNGTQSAAAVVRAWYDEQRNAPLTADVQVGLLMDAIRSNDTLVMELTRARRRGWRAVCDHSQRSRQRRLYRPQLHIS